MSCTGGSGFFLACNDFGGRFDDSFPDCAFCFFKWRSACTHPFHILGKDQPTVAQRAEMTVAGCSLTQMSCSK